jgi:alcohol dehydrogenase (NADP+)
MKTNAYAAYNATDLLKPFAFERRTVGAHDVKIDILYCGVCHSDLHQAHNDWKNSIYPMVPGHEIVGRIVEVGAHVEKFKVGELAGVGCFVDSCRTCPECRAGLEQYCTGTHGMSPTYNGYEQDHKTPTYGGYSTNIVVDEKYTLHVSDKLPLEGVAPLLCAGITTYSPLRHWKVGRGTKVGVVGLGGLGHMAVKLAASFGAEVTLFSTSKSKRTDAKQLGAHHFVLTSDPENFKPLAHNFDFIIDTVSATHDYSPYLDTLKTDGVMVCVGLPTDPISAPPFSLVGYRRSVAGSMIGGIAETQEMLDYCAEHNITSDIEVIPIQAINQAYERMVRNDVKYRFVIDMASLKNAPVPA